MQCDPGVIGLLQVDLAFTSVLVMVPTSQNRQGVEGDQAPGPRRWEGRLAVTKARKCDSSTLQVFDELDSDRDGLSCLHHYF